MDWMSWAISYNVRFIIRFDIKSHFIHRKCIIKINNSMCFTVTLFQCFVSSLYESFFHALCGVFFGRFILIRLCLYLYHLSFNLCLFHKNTLCVEYIYFFFSHSQCCSRHPKWNRCFDVSYFVMVVIRCFFLSFRLSVRSADILD